MKVKLASDVDALFVCYDASDMSSLKLVSGFLGMYQAHGFHVFSGVVINIIVLIMTMRGVFERRGHYLMIEKVGTVNTGERSDSGRTVLVDEGGVVNGEG